MSKQKLYEAEMTKISLMSEQSDLNCRAAALLQLLRKEVKTKEEAKAK